MKKEKKIRWWPMIILGGAFTSYNVGSGFATGAECFQFFGSWGGWWPFISAAIILVLTLAAAYCCFLAGQTCDFAKAKDAYSYFAGKKLGWFFDLCSYICIFGFNMTMFAGVGATMNQYWGLPIYLSAIVMGVIACVVACLGLHKVMDTLGVIGIIIVVYVLAVCVGTIATSDQSIFEAEAHVLEYVDQGLVFQSGVLGVHNPVLGAVFYWGCCMIATCPFAIALGKSTRNRREALAAGTSSGVMLTAGALLVTCCVLFNLDSIVETGSNIYMLTAVSNLVPHLSWTFAILLTLGIFTTIVGELWLIADRFSDEGTLKSRLIIIGVTCLGVFAGSVIPFNTIVNWFYPYTGLVGALLCICIFGKTIMVRRAAKKALPDAGEAQPESAE